MISECDVLVVGAGPAGSTAAISIKQKLPQLRVVLVDKATFPRDKVCGDAVSPGALAIAERLGLLGDLVASHHRVDECVLFGSDDGPLVTPIPKIGHLGQFGLVAKRMEFDNQLVKSAIACGVEFLPDTRFLGSQTLSGGARSTALEIGDEKFDVVASLVVGADGANSRVRNAVGQKRNSDRTTAIAIRSYIEFEATDQVSNRLMFEINEDLCPGYGWFFPVSETEANFGVGISVSEFKRRKIDLKEILHRYKSSLYELGLEFGGQTNIATYTLPHGGHLPKLAHQRCVLIGDAASMINPLSGEGIFYGMAAGEMLANSLSDDLSQRELRRFERSFKKRFRLHYFNNYIAMRAIKSWPITRRAFNTIQNDPEALRSAASMMFGEGHMSLKTLTRLGWHALST